MSKRFYARYAGKPGFQEVYEVVDSHTGHPMTPSTDYHLANIGAAARNGEAVEPEAAWTISLLGSPVTGLFP